MKRCAMWVCIAWVVLIVVFVMVEYSAENRAYKWCMENNYFTVRGNVWTGFYCSRLNAGHTVMHPVGEQ